MSKYQQFFNEMLKQNQSLFDEFKKVHDLYSNEPKVYQEKFNELGYEVQDIIRRYENRLCSKSEGTGYGKFSTNLAEKFQKEVKAYFPKIDSIGLNTT